MGGFDGDRDRVLWAVAVLGQQLQELAQALRGVVDAELVQEGAGLVEQCDVVVVGGPVDAAEHAGHRGVLGWVAVV